MEKKIETVDDIELLLNQRGLFHLDMSLGRMEQALSTLRLTNPPFRVLQVVGTNGKGSTSTFLASLCTAHGLSAGLYTSPHFVSFSERIRLDGELVAAEKLVEAAQKVAQVDLGLTYFEFLTLLALEVFADAGVDVAILEAGLGGAHDATTAVSRDLLCLSPIALDHAQIIGPTIQDIAEDKCGAMRPHLPVVSSQQFRNVEKIITAVARKLDCPLVLARPLPENLCRHIALQGVYQKENASLALTAFDLLQAMLARGKCRYCVEEAFEKAFLPGRLQYVPADGTWPSLLLDGAHNPHGMENMLRSLSALDYKPGALVFAALADKDWHSVMRILKQNLPELPCYFAKLHNERSLEAALASKAWYGGKIEHTGELREILSAPELRAHAPVLVTGSLYLLAEVYKLRPELLSAPREKSQGEV